MTDRLCVQSGQGKPGRCRATLDLADCCIQGCRRLVLRFELEKEEEKEEKKKKKGKR